MRQAVQREALRVALFLDDDQQSLAASVGPLEQQWDVQLAKPVAEAFLELLLANGYDLGAREAVVGFFRGEEGKRRMRIVQDQILEVLVVTHPTKLTRSDAAAASGPRNRLASASYRCSVLRKAEMSGWRAEALDSVPNSARQVEYHLVV